MESPIIIFSADAPIEIHGGEGGSGPLYWKRLVGGVDLHGDWESFEYARVAAHGVIGEHVHWRTEELYYVTSGRARMYLDDVPHDIVPGDLILTPIDGKHRADAIGDEDFEFIVAEVLPPESLNPELKASHPSPKLPQVVLKLGDGKPIDPTKYFAGPWQSIQLLRVAPGDHAEFSGATAEHCFYVVRGKGSARSGSRTIDLSPGHGLAVPKGGDVTVEAGNQGLELFLTSVRL